MVFVTEKKINGIKYIYLDKSIRIKKKIFKINKYLGKKSNISKKKINEEIKKFALETDRKIISLFIKNIKNKYNNPEYPLDFTEIEKIEDMNIKYLEIKNSLDKKDWMDIKKRFVANFVFESNALEGNSLTLKNFSEIIFENKTDSSVDLRDVYDAKNSYEVFSKLFTSRKKITERFIIDLHKKIIKNIDSRTGYKKLPNILLGRTLQLTQPEDVRKEMSSLVEWYRENKDKIYPLELAFKFHHKFERIHPFADGNGRVGRMLLNCILIKNGYYPVIIRKTERGSYLKALEVADSGKYASLMRFALDKAKDTYRKFFEVYYNYI